MQGFIRQRGSSFTVYWSTVDPATGKRRQHTKGGFKRKEPARQKDGTSAREFLNSIIGSLDAGTWKPDTTLTVAQLLRDHYLPARRSEGLRATTMDQYENAANAWVIPHLGAAEVRGLTPAAVLAFQTTLAATGSKTGGALSPRSVQLAITVLKAATKWAAANGYLQRDPLAGYRRPKAGNSKAKDVWTLEQVRHFLACTADDRLAAAWSLFVNYGPRRGEVAGLRWPNVHLDGKPHIDIAETRVMVDGHPQTSTPKTEAGNRQIPLSADVVALLKAHRARQLEERMRLGLGRDEQGYVFTTPLGEPVSPDWLSRRFVELATAADLPRLTVHGLRHTAVSVMRSLGLAPEVIAAIVGHSSTVVTMTVYRHLFPKETAEVADVMSRALRGDAVTNG